MNENDNLTTSEARFLRNLVEGRTVANWPRAKLTELGAKLDRIALRAQPARNSLCG